MTTGGLGATDIGNKYAVTGLARLFYRRIGEHYNKFEQWTFPAECRNSNHEPLCERCRFRCPVLSPDNKC